MARTAWHFYVQASAMANRLKQVLVVLGYSFSGVLTLISPPFGLLLFAFLLLTLPLCRPMSSPMLLQLNEWGQGTYGEIERPCKLAEPCLLLPWLVIVRFRFRAEYSEWHWFWRDRMTTQEWTRLRRICLTHTQSVQTPKA